MPSPNPIIEYFSFQHLPPKLKGVSQVLSAVAHLVNDNLEVGAEKSAGLRKLLEAKDCFVRQALKSEKTVAIGDLSDGFHSFNELYAHRMELFKVICHQNKSHAWKSKLHHDGTMFDDYFIVGVETPEGQFTYHYPLKHWAEFEVKALENAPAFDGHTSNDVVRLHSLDMDWTDAEPSNEQ